EFRFLFCSANGEHLLMKFELLAHQLCFKRCDLGELLCRQSFAERTTLICIAKLATLCLDLLHQRTDRLSAALAKLFHLCLLGISQIQIAEELALHSTISPAPAASLSVPFVRLRERDRGRDSDSHHGGQRDCTNLVHSTHCLPLYLCIFLGLSKSQQTFVC